MKQFTLGKNERLKSRRQIELLFKEGKSFSVAPLKVFYMVTALQEKTETEMLQFGVGVSTKNFKKAVDRNRVKRMVREAYRLQKNELKAKMKLKKIQVNLFFIYTGKALPVYKDVFEKTGTALQKIEQTIEPSSTSAK